MPMYDKRALEYEARKFGFRRDTFEKVVRLKDILNYINNTDFLNNHLVLKGGTAINLTVFDLPRLSVDIDMDYMPNDTKEEMSKTREEIKNNLLTYMESEGYVLSLDSRYMHSLDGFHFQYVNAGGNKDTIKIEINNEFEKKNYGTELLFNDSRIIERIQNHPMALWKCR